MYRMNPVRADREDEKRMLPCRYFLTGICHKGNRCKFYHPNVHGRDPVIRVPDLPEEFSMPLSMSQFNGGGGLSLLEMTYARNSRARGMQGYMRNGFSSPVGMRRSPNTSPRGPRGNDGYNKNLLLSPSTMAYAEFLSMAQHQRLAREKSCDTREREDQMEQIQETKPTQNTVFNHIDWSEFLTPGIDPPLPTIVPDQAGAISPVRPIEQNFDPPELWRSGDSENRGRKHILKVNNEDVPPEGSSYLMGKAQAGHSDAESLLSSSDQSASRLSAKEELQMKVKQIAQELADEPIQHVRSLDSFFRNFKFNGFGMPSDPNDVKE